MLGPTRIIFLTAILFTWGTIEALESNSWIPTFAKDAEFPTEKDAAKVAENPTIGVKRIPSFINTKEFNNSLIIAKELKNGESVVGCGSYTLNPGKTVIIRSKNYPYLFPRWQSCLWNFQASCPRSRISISCPVFSLTWWCRWCFLMVKGGDLEKLYCRQNNGLSASSTTTSMAVYFRSRWVRGRGFECYVHASKYCGTVNRATRIVGGEETEVNEYPWQVAVVNNGTDDILCAGSLYNDRYIITSSAVVNYLKVNNVNVDVLLGAHDLDNQQSTVQRISVEDFIIHENYNPSTWNNNIGLLKLSHAATLNYRVKPACLPNPSKDYDDVNAIVSGWGTTSAGGSQSNVLLELEVPTMSNSECNNITQNQPNITDNMICAGFADLGKGPCSGDFGGPLATKENDKWILIGIFSVNFGCGNPNYPEIYTRVSKYVDWIAANIGGSSTCPHSTAP